MAHTAADLLASISSGVCSCGALVRPVPFGDEWAWVDANGAAECDALTHREHDCEQDEAAWALAPQCCGWPMALAPSGWVCRENGAHRIDLP